MVSKIDAARKRVYLDDGTEISYDKCLLSTGKFIWNLEKNL